MTEQREGKGGLAEALPTDALKEAGQQLLGLLVQRATEAATQRVSGLADRLTDVTASGGDVRAVLSGGRAGDDDAENGEQDGKPGVLARAWSSATEKVKDVLGGGSGGGGAKKLKMTNIVESLDVGLPLRTTYDLWTQFEDFPSFMKKVETVEQASDEKTNWTAKVFWSRRSWEATVVEQVPDSHIVWRSTGAKGHVDGAVTFTELGPNGTRVLLVMEYWPKGLFENTGNLWRAQGRRTRLEFKHFRRHAMTSAILHQDEIEGWRGEIRDSKVVMTHEEALEKAQAQAEAPGAAQPAAEDRTAEEEISPGDVDEDVADEDAPPVEDDELYEDEEYDEGEEPYADEAGEEAEADEADDEYADEADEYADEAEEADEYADEDGEDVNEADSYPDEDHEYADEGTEPAPAGSGSRG